MLSSVIRLLASLTLAVGVSVAVQVTPPSLLARPLNAPLASAKSAVVRPLTASLKVIVTSEVRSEEHTSELQSLMRISYAVFCLKKKINTNHKYTTSLHIHRSNNNKHYTQP